MSSKLGFEVDVGDLETDVPSADAIVKSHHSPLPGSFPQPRPTVLPPSPPPFSAFFDLPNTMSPPCHAFSVEQLSDKVQEDVKGKRRKLDGNAKHVDLSACELLEMPQFKCDVEKPVTAESRVVCQEVVRSFRR